MTVGSEPAPQVFDFAFEPRYERALGALGVNRGTAKVTLTADAVSVRFGRWRTTTPLANVADVQVSGPYRWYRVIGPHLSLADRGVSFGTTTDAGVCLLLREPVPGLDPFGWLRHPGITVTVAQPEAFAAAVREHLAHATVDLRDPARKET